ncbi:sterol-4-alpha-carboxylate 3-dehydrogenase [Trematosphaeria pertusa]|uniref:Sterol-4-alpha-carboxylate 3-dehydrogenase n=1 Tax=Trematosphaeria pertusa TaxID=390896 RepID=A0A6A6ISU8_9PLEO|nr:sterol-4-alpha-carboxylate 3-dehydrogenase [Trematosphaeria pertusa]KAF2252902.1 sterol-4-alpha-carboxylate 3-dehydrogenase [Trematosphaeria pertusa]
MEPANQLSSVLVIGGCGFLGHHIVRKLLQSDDVSQVTVVDLRTDFYRVEGAHYIKGSITSRDDVMCALDTARPRVIFHTVSPQALGNPRLFTEVNIGGTRNLLECAQSCGFTKALVYTSSSSVVHDNYSDLAAVTEDMPLLFMPQQPELYSHTKAVAEKMVLDANKIAGIRTCAIRPAGMIGEGDRTTAGNIIGGAKEGKYRIQIGDDSKLFDWTYVGNNADAQLLAARALLRSHTSPPPDNLKVDGEAFVITNDDPRPFWNFLRTMGAAAGYPVKKEDVWAIPASLMWAGVFITEILYFVFTLGRKQPRFTRANIKYMTIHRYFDISKAKTRLGYVPQLSLEDGIQRTVQWYWSITQEEKDQSDSFRKLV